MGPGRRNFVAIIGLLAGLVPSLIGQSAKSAPVTGTLAMIERYPTFFHGRTVSVVGTPTIVDGLWRLPLTGSKVLVFLPRAGTPPLRQVEVRGQLFDTGRFDAEDSRLSISGIRAVVEKLSPASWPARNQLFVLTDATWRDDETSAASIRSIVLHPRAFEGSRVTLRGRFRAQNLYGDLPAWPRKSNWDFVLQVGDGSIWVTGLRPRGKDFDLDPGARRGAGTWLEVTGLFRLVDDLPTIEAKTITRTTAGEDTASEPALDTLGPPELPAVIFSVPLDGERDADPGAPVRIQFSRNMKPESFEGSVRVQYGEGVTARVPSFTTEYLAHLRALEIKFSAPLAGDTDVVLQLSEGIVTVDDAPLAPLTIKFRTKAGRSPRTGPSELPREPSRD